MNHLSISLHAAARLAVSQDGYRSGSIDPTKWALTYRCSADEVTEALKLAENGKRRLPEEIAASTKPTTREEEEFE